MIRPSIDKLIEVLKGKKYRVFNSPDVDWNLNIIGVRNKNLVPEKFDDTLIVFHQFLGEWHITYYPVTTDPSVYWLKNPAFKKGTAILKEGQYRRAYTIRKHRGKYQALCQKYKGRESVQVYRDASRDGRMNFDEATVETGKFGINIHKVNMNGTWDSNTKDYSMGCTIFADARHFREFMLKCKFGAEAFGNSFTYTLINEADLSD